MNINNLVQKAVKHGVGSIEDTMGPLTPFTFIFYENDNPEQRVLKLTRHESELLEESLEQAQNSIAPDQGILMYAIVWDGFVTFEDRKWDAILIEAGESQAAEGTIYAQRYELKEKSLFSRKHCNVKVGKPLCVGPTNSRLRRESHA